MKQLQKENIGPAVIALTENQGEYIVTLDDGDIHKVAPFADYETAILVYEGTCQQASQIHKTERALPPPPDFTKTLNI